ncbi:histidinol dehydrogenase [Microbacterium sp. CFH 90308]|uniref:Histidinol dehydrogenase n=1 Tax=Microbacterium salsuginis TaxID=2722803 RepID=A0ABX1K5D4_9MICO|nr:histidinol dehydrogenase [Microbacterium sp. CFH 90308]
MRTSVLARIGTWVVALLIGAVYGLAGTIAHAYRIGWLPVGLVLAAIGCAALLLAVRLLTADRGATLATGLGMMLATLVFSGSGPGGSVIVPQTELAIAWTFAVPILVAVIVAWPERTRATAGRAAPR